MFRTRIVPRLLVTLLSIFLCTFLSADETRFLLKQLDNTLDLKSDYERVLLLQIENLTESAGRCQSADEKASVYFSVASRYLRYSLDSTLFYLQKVHRCADISHDEQLHQKADFFMAYAYAGAGYHFEAGDIISRYDVSTLESESESEFMYYLSSYKLYGELLAYSKDSHHSWVQQQICRKYLLEHTPQNTFPWYRLMRDEMYAQGKREEERRYAEMMVESSEEGTNDYATAAYYMSITFERKDPEKRFQWLVKSAISDISSATRDYESLNSVSRILYAKGEIERAFKYTADYCLPDALSFNGKLRPHHIARFFSDLEHAYQSQRDRESHVKTVYLAVLIVLVVLLALMTCLIMHRQRTLKMIKNKLQKSNDDFKEINGQLTQLNIRLKESDKIKEEYISLFLSILSEQIDKQRKYQYHVLKNLRKGNVALIEDEIKNAPGIDDDISEFYKMFDQTFMNMYPDFVERFNGLLKEGEEIIPKNGDLLAPEQRIYALMKLGICDSSRIASLLHYSTTTIYNYKTRVRNKARGPRDQFELDLIGHI